MNAATGRWFFIFSINVIVRNLRLFFCGEVVILVLVKRRYTHHLDLVIFLSIALCLDYNAIYIIDDKLETKYMSCDKKEPKILFIFLWRILKNFSQNLSSLFNNDEEIYLFKKDEKIFNNDDEQYDNSHITFVDILKSCSNYCV